MIFLVTPIVLTKLVEMVIPSSDGVRVQSIGKLGAQGWQLRLDRVKVEKVVPWVWLK